MAVRDRPEQEEGAPSAPRSVLANETGAWDRLAESVDRLAFLVRRGPIDAARGSSYSDSVARLLNVRLREIQAAIQPLSARLRGYAGSRRTPSGLRERR